LHVAEGRLGICLNRMEPHFATETDKSEGDRSVLESLLFLSATPNADGTAEDAARSTDTPQVGQWDTTSPSPCENQNDNMIRQSPPEASVPASATAELSPTASANNRGHWSVTPASNKTPQTSNKRAPIDRASVLKSDSPSTISLLGHRQSDDKLTPLKDYYARDDFDGSLKPLDEYYTWSYAEFRVMSPNNDRPATEHTLDSLMDLSKGYGESSRRHVIPKSTSLYLVAEAPDLFTFLSDSLHVHAFVCLCNNCLQLHNSGRERSDTKIRLLLKKPNASPHYSKAILNGGSSDQSTISYDQRTGYCSLSHPTHPKSVCMLCVPVKQPIQSTASNTMMFPIRTSTTNSCSCPRTQLKRAAAVSRQHVAKKTKPNQSSRTAHKREPGEDEAALLLRKFSSGDNVVM